MHKRFQGAYDDKWCPEQKKLHATIGDVTGGIVDRTDSFWPNRLDGASGMAVVQDDIAL
jgi:hypothetical protein